MDYNNNFENMENNEIYNNQNNGKTPGQGSAIASMVCGILSIVFCSCYGIMGIVLGIIAIVLHNSSKRDSGGNASGMAKAGLVCGIIGLSLGAIYVVLVFLLGVSIGLADLL